MTIRWKKILPILITGTSVLMFPVIYKHINPDHFSGIACLRTYPDGHIEKDMGQNCYDPKLPEAIVLKAR